MAKRLNKSDYRIGLFDSATGRSLPTLKAVEITQDCVGSDKRERAILLFAKATRGRIVQVLRPYPGMKIGAAAHFFLDEIDGWIGSETDMDLCLKRDASLLGIERQKLRDMMFKHAPR